jgi:hypothetical protein
MALLGSRRGVSGDPAENRPGNSRRIADEPRARARMRGCVREDARRCPVGACGEKFPGSTEVSAVREARSGQDHPL